MPDTFERRGPTGPVDGRSSAAAPSRESGAGVAPPGREPEGLGREPAIYRHRFGESERRARRAVWRVLCRDFLQRWIDPGDTVVDVGAGDGLFLTHIRAARRIAVDLAPEVRALTREGIEVFPVPATELAAHLDAPVDVVFMSNFLEHLPTKRHVLEVLDACHGALRPGGRLLVLQPNIRYAGAAYWDCIDHQVALTEKSLVEAVLACGFEVERLIPRFLPYTARSPLARLAPLTALYLRLPLLWRLFGAQTFLAAVRRGPGVEVRP